MNAARFSGWWKNRETVKTELKNSWWGEDDGGGGDGCGCDSPLKISLRGFNTGLPPLISNNDLEPTSRTEATLQI